MSDLLAARSQMAVSLAFHIVFAVAGIAMPVLMAIAEGLWLRRHHPVDLELARRWSRGVAILFAVGAVSGTVLSFELGLLWPRFMAFAGPIIGMPFSLEGFAFFLEAIFLGIYLYGWERVPRVVHWLCGIGVAVTGAASGLFVLTANSWMNHPAGFRLVEGRVVDVNPWAAMFHGGWSVECVHMLLAAYLCVGFAVAAIHARELLRDGTNLFHRRALTIALLVGGIAAALQPVSGDASAKLAARTQPAKLAAMEGQFESEPAAPLRIGGIPDERAERTRGAIEIPGALSWLAYGDPRATIRGLKAWPREDRPPTAVVHVAFQIMVGSGVLLLALSILALVRRRTLFESRRLLTAIALGGWLGFVALEAGWTVTEVGRQPWIVYGILRTADSVTPMPGLMAPFLLFTFLYLFLAGIVGALLRRHVFASPRLPAS